ncbi:MAG: hypothetical protein B7X32_15675 [Microbacterium sp. 13-71-7]|nr:MAG: hypothetical protein B7X32_15675 [Microbacterium sp. 13-71-7]
MDGVVDQAAHPCEVLVSIAEYSRGKEAVDEGENRGRELPGVQSAAQLARVESLFEIGLEHLEPVLLLRVHRLI